MIIFKILPIFFLFFSCGSYIERVHKQLDEETKPKQSEDSFSYFKNSKNNPNINSNNNRQVIPNVKRKYIKRKRHYKDSDFADNWSEGSLWAGDEKTNYFFSKDNFKKIGDLVIIEVQKILKQEIVLELQKYSLRKIYQNLKKAAEIVKDPKKELEKPEEENIGDPTADTKVYDKIPGMVIEQINQDHLFIKGRKDILYKKRKRLIEVQAIIARRNINDNDTIKSNDILESKVKVLR